MIPTEDPKTVLPREASADPVTRVFVALSGGGAKGVIHVGALKALEAEGVAFRGLAGTSAGAIVAALKASGFNADDLVDPVTNTTIFDALAKIDPKLAYATDLFGRVGWLRVRTARWLLAAASRIGAGRLALLVLGAVLVGIIVASDRGEPCGWGSALVGFGVLLVVFAALRTALGGLADLERFRAALALLVQRRMFQAEPGRVVTMADYGVGGRAELKIVAANLSTRSLELFSRERTPGVAVADAVVASIAVPFLFRLPVLGGQTYADGGLVSDLPAWSFDEKRELDPDAYTIAVDIADAPTHARLGRYGWLGAAFRTALFGSGELDLRAVGREETITLATEIGLLDFDLPKARFIAVARDGEAAARARIVLRLFELPRRFRDMCALVRDIVDAAFTADPTLLASGHRSGRVRVAVALPDTGYTRSLRLCHAVGYEGCPDQRILLPIEGSVVGAAFRTGEARIDLAPLPPELDLPGPENAMLRARRWPTIEWTACVPVAGADGRSAFVVVVDGDETLSPAGHAAIASLLHRIRRVFGAMVADASPTDIAAASLGATVQRNPANMAAEHRGANAADTAWAEHASAANRLIERTRSNRAEHRRLVGSIGDKALRASVQ